MKLLNVSIVLFAILTSVLAAPIVRSNGAVASGPDLTRTELPPRWAKVANRLSFGIPAIVKRENPFTNINISELPTSWWREVPSKLRSLWQTLKGMSTSTSKKNGVWSDSLAELAY
ncbi:hypothetical protein FRC02_005804 [Tulasnella sp. 418]|nr:hypothetical protein FRC02_005804 [Tulasnella sp. 418]